MCKYKYMCTLTSLSSLIHLSGMAMLRRASKPRPPSATGRHKAGMPLTSSAIHTACRQQPDRIGVHRMYSGDKVYAVVRIWASLTDAPSCSMHAYIMLDLQLDTNKLFVDKTALHALHA